MEIVSHRIVPPPPSLSHRIVFLSLCLSVSVSVPLSLSVCLSLSLSLCLCLSVSLSMSLSLCLCLCLSLSSYRSPHSLSLCLSLSVLGEIEKSNASDKIDINVRYDHFKNILGHTPNETVDESNLQVQDVSEETNHSLNEEISVDEVQKAITNLKSGKACDLDHIRAEMLKTGGKDVILLMTKLFNKVFDKGIYPSDWAKANIVPVLKKGDMHVSDNYRGVSLL